MEYCAMMPRVSTTVPHRGPWIWPEDDSDYDFYYEDWMEEEDDSGPEC